MRRSLLIVLLTALILALMVPLYINVLQSQPAFTQDNLIFLGNKFS